MKKNTVLILILLCTFLYATEIAKIMIEIPSKKRFLFGDKIIYRVKIESLLRFDTIKIKLSGKMKPDYFNYKFSKVEYRNNYISKGTIIFQFFKTGEIKLPDFNIMLLKNTKEGKITIFKKKFNGLKFFFISALKGNEKLSSPLSPLSSNFLIIVIVCIIILFVLSIFVIRKKRVKYQEEKPTFLLSEGLKRLDNMKKISLNKSLLFETGKMIRDSLSLLNKKEMGSLTVKEMTNIIKKGTDNYELNKRGVELLKKIEMQKFSYNEIQENIIYEISDYLQQIIKKVENV